MKFNKALIIAAGLAVALLPVFADTAMAWNYGDVFAAVGNGRVNRYASDGTFIEQLNTGLGAGVYTTGMAFDASANLYVTGFNSNALVRFASNGTLLGAFGGGYNANPESIVFDKSGNAYVGHADGNGDIYKFNSAGAYQTQYNVVREDRGSDWIDLAADQKTMYYTSEGEKIFRYDVSTGTQLADFAVGLGRPAYALRILDDGGVLVATNAMVKRLDAAGNVVQTYDVGGVDGWFALNLDPNGTTFWSGSFVNGTAYQFNIATGSVLQTINTGSSDFYGLTIFGEKTQGGPNPVPEPGTIALLGLGLAGMGIRLRRKR